MGRRIRVRGQVQGVGFRPFVWQLARAHGVTGTVANDASGVIILAEGPDLDAFEAAIATTAPPLARVDAIESGPHDFELAPPSFEIVASGGGAISTSVTPDAATCRDCQAEIADPGARRFGYAFTNCTQCGPRFSILQELPYDRATTTMADFQMCDACRAEYSDPADRRFHAQPIACPDCGPRLWLEAGEDEVEGDPISLAAERLRAGQILAVKGLGGFHLACDATNADAVARLRARKRRPAKPLALMGDAAIIARHADPSPVEFRRLRDPAAPIVLLRKAGVPLPDTIAPGQATLGWMLPYTPSHHLLIAAVGRPLVMTSGNLSGEPQVICNDEARTKLTPFCDGFLMHDRPIARRLDDGVERETAQGPMILRRARGRSPATMPLPPGFEDAPAVLAFGGQLKSTICLTKHGEALLSHHLGDLDDALTWEAYLEAEADYAALFDHRPEVFAVDLHPGYRATQHGLARAADVPLIEVQHHHAHLAAAIGDAGWAREDGPVAGIILDGLGLGTDGTVWGGEVLVGDYTGFRRAAWLNPAALPGGDAAQREPWRNLLVRLDQSGFAELADELLDVRPRDLIRRAVAGGVNAPLSSSAGRLFDAMAAVLGFDEAQTFEGQAAMWLEGLSASAPPEEVIFPYLFGYRQRGGALDDRELWELVALDLRNGVAPEIMALRFHYGVAASFAREARDLVESGEARAVALSGGCFQNALLLDLTVRELGDVPVLIHRNVPASDGGLAFGQALVAAATALTDT